MEMGLAHLWSQMSILPRSVVIILLLMSIWSLYVTIERMLVYRKAKKQSLAVREAGSHALRTGSRAGGTRSRA